MTLRRSPIYNARLAETPEDLDAAQALRFRAFRGAEGGGRDRDRFDAACDHMLVEHRASGRLVATYRLLTLTSGAEVERSYSAQFYALGAMEGIAGPIVEMGRFCVDPDVTDPDVLRVAWGALARYVDDIGAEMLIGCSSFAGTDEAVYADAFAMLRDRHLGPRRWLPKIKAPKVFRFAQRLRGVPDPKRALQSMPPLLRSYLSLGGWVSDHAVIDHDMNTLHVFTGLSVRDIPPKRARALRALSA
ncbi:MAG: GNAT family N-acyltransferase [Pseudomonadota bacterium]